MYFIYGSVAAAAEAAAYLRPALITQYKEAHTFSQTARRLDQPWVTPGRYIPGTLRSYRVFSTVCTYIPALRAAAASIKLRSKQAEHCAEAARTTDPDALVLLSKISLTHSKYYYSSSLSPQNVGAVLKTLELSGMCRLVGASRRFANIHKCLANRVRGLQTRPVSSRC